MIFTVAKSRNLASIFLPQSFKSDATYLKSTAKLLSSHDWPTFFLNLIQFGPRNFEIHPGKGAP